MLMQGELRMKDKCLLFSVLSFINDLPLRINSLSEPILFANDTSVMFKITGLDCWLD